MLSSARPPFDLPSHLRNSHEKINGNGRTSSHTSRKGSLGEGSDIYPDAVNGGRYQINGGGHHDENLNGVTHGRSSMSSWEHKSSRNGSTYSVNGPSNGVLENGRKSPGPPSVVNGRQQTNGDVSRNSYSSTNGTIQPAAAESASKPTTNGDSAPARRISIPAPVSTNPQSTGALTYQSSLFPATPQSLDATPSRATTTSLHRLSSPAIYSSPSGATSPSTQSLPHPGLAQLKHRHTLQVPKVGNGRNSRDGEDLVYSTGRFSPTATATAIGTARRGSLSLNRRNTQSIHSNIPHEEIVPDEDAMR